MPYAQATKLKSEGGGRDTLFDRIGRFLDAQHLSPDPAHYGFAFAVLSEPQGPLARDVARLTEGGVRLRRQDIERLGGRVVERAPPHSSPEQGGSRATEQPNDLEIAIALVDETQQQVDGFAQIVRTMEVETQDFGRDLAQSAAAITTIKEIYEIADMISTMIVRIRDSEIRLAMATAETRALRAKLAEARDSARRDMLTGLPNRRAFEEAVADRDPNAGPHCLAVCDVDRFKGINDLHGHAVGDRVLTAIGQAMARQCAPHLVVRHGGEEFAVLISGLDLAEAAALLDSVRATVATRNFRNRETDAPLGPITFSAGITAIHIEETVDRAFARADRLLYTAKEQGRDRICAG